MTTDGDLIVLSDDEEVLMFKGTVEMGQSKEAIRPPKEKDKFAELRKCAECSAFLGSGKSHLLECLHVLCQNCLDAKFSGKISAGGSLVLNVFFSIFLFI